jgi:hypothetical protein
LRTDPQSDIVSAERQPFVLKALKRLTIGKSQSTFTLHYMTCPSLTYLHFTDIRPGKTSAPQFSSTTKEFIQRSQSNRLTLRLTGSTTTAIIQSLVLTEPHPVIHHLEIEELDPLLRSLEKCIGRLPKTLEDIVMLRKPSSVVQGQSAPSKMRVASAAMLQPTFGRPRPGSPLIAAAASFWKGRKIRQSRFWVFYVPIPYIVTVYVPEGRALGLLEADEEEFIVSSNLLLVFPDVSEDSVWQMLSATGGCIPAKARALEGR